LDDDDLLLSFGLLNDEEDAEPESIIRED
jgi:hypothetical protein